MKEGAYGAGSLVQIHTFTDCSTSTVGTFCDSPSAQKVQFRSTWYLCTRKSPAQFKMVSVHLENGICALGKWYLCTWKSSAFCAASCLSEDSSDNQKEHLILLLLHLNQTTEGFHTATCLVFSWKYCLLFVCVCVTQRCKAGLKSVALV